MNLDSMLICQVFSEKINPWLVLRPGFMRTYLFVIVEVRFVAKDDIYLSPAYGQDVCYIGIIMFR